MGVTIHYHGSLDDAAQLDAAMAMLREECERRGWPYRELDVEARGPHETYTFRDVPGPLPGWTDTLTETEMVELDTRWRGLSIDPHGRPVVLTTNMARLTISSCASLNLRRFQYLYFCAPTQ